MICRICRSEMVEIETIECISPIKALNKQFNIKLIPNILYKCPLCTHMQMKSVCSDDYYDDDYVSDNVHFAKLSDNKLRKLEKLKKYSPDGLSCLNIGCGEGNDFSLASQLFKKIVGVEPAKNYYNYAKLRAESIASDRNYKIEVINEYFGIGNAKFGGEFSAFYSLMVFEHVDNPTAMLSSAYDSLKDEGVGLINVPNGQAIYKRGMFSLFPVEHINYYTPLSLAFLANKCGYDVLEINTNEYEKENLYEMDLFVIKSKGNIGFLKSKQNNAEKLSTYLEGCDSIVIWGAGNNAHGYARLLKPEYKIMHIVDSCKEREGQYINRLNIPVEVVDESIINSSDAIIIFASSFNKEIISSLKHTYRYDGKVIIIEKGEVVLLDMNRTDQLSE